ncbi:MAG: hypothetical protein NZ742_05840 [Acidobacteria bacterium]|nr:hypothetical protein [Acidobacteriota bacterium]MDW7984394.1 hypothetical protein [Acidobacteriota bacterium]
MNRYVWLSRFVLWVWPSMFLVVAGLFYPGLALGGWAAVGIGLLLMEGFQWAERQPGAWSFKFLTGAGVLALLSAGLFWQWPQGPAVAMLVQAVILIGIGIVFRWFQVPTVFPVAGRWPAVFLTLGEFLYCAGWLALAWLYRYMPRGGTALEWPQWLASPLPWVALLLSLQFIGLQALFRSNLEHPGGRSWLKSVRLAVTVGMVAGPVVGVHLFRLPSLWYLIGLLWLYTYRTYERTRAWLRQWEAGEFSPRAHIELQHRTLREALYYGLVLLGLVGNSFLR